MKYGDFHHKAARRQKCCDANFACRENAGARGIGGQIPGSRTEATYLRLLGGIRIKDSVHASAAPYTTSLFAALTRHQGVRNPLMRA